MPTSRPIHLYTVHFRSKDTGDRWTSTVTTYSFALAEDYGVHILEKYGLEKSDEIISIEKDY